MVAAIDRAFSEGVGETPLSMRAVGMTGHWKSPSRRTNGSSMAQCPTWAGTHTALMPPNLVSTEDCS